MIEKQITTILLSKCHDLLDMSYLVTVHDVTKTDHDSHNKFINMAIICSFAYYPIRYETYITMDKQPEP